MKRLHRPELFSWSRFDEARDVDFNGTLIQRPEGNVLVDPMPLSDHDAAHLRALGGAAWIVLTNSDHVRATEQARALTGARVAGPLAERGHPDLPCDRWLGDDEELVPGLRALALAGSKTPGELALVWQGHTLITGDLVRAHQGGRLNLLPPDKLADRAAALASVRRLAALPEVEAVLVGDGWPLFSGARAHLAELAG